jgi:hypothetical protein
LTFNNHLTKYKRVFVAKLHYNVGLDMFYIKSPAVNFIYENETNIRHQKNWIPFDFCPNCTYHYGGVSSAYHSNNIRNFSTIALAHEITTGDGTTVVVVGHNGSNNAVAPSRSYRHGSSKANSAGAPSAVLLFSYSLQPHRVVQGHPWHVENVWSAETVFMTEILKEYEWKWGEMRGGSQALLIDESRHLGFFHSSGRLSHRNIITYVMGAYTFDRFDCAA